MRTSFLSIDGEPVAKDRPRATVRTRKDGSSYPHVYTPDRTSEAERIIWAHFKDRYPGMEPIAEPFALTLRFFEGPRQAEKQQDLDNLQKLVLDALNGHAWVDDRLCEVLTAVVVRGAALPHTEIDIRTLSPSEIATNSRQLPLEAAH